MINESHGILTDQLKVTDKLVKLIADYIYDAEDGLNSYIDLNPSEQPIITMSILKSYWKYKNNQLFDNSIIPNWVGNFHIEIEEHNKQIYAACYKHDAVLNNNKLDFTIAIVDHSGKSYEQFFKELTHEFRHAYTDYIKKCTNTSLYDIDKDLYKLGTQYANKCPLIANWSHDYLQVNWKIYTDEEYITSTIFKSIYYINPGEVQAFLQEYAVALKMLAQSHTDEIIDAFEKTDLLKKDYNKLTRSEQWAANVQNVLSFTYYDISIFRIYRALYIFWNNINRIDLDLLDDIILKNREVFIKLFKTRNIHINVQGDGLKLLSKLGTHYKRILARMLKKMYEIYYDIIYGIEKSKENNENTSESIDKIIKDDIILDSDFEMDLLNLMSDIKINNNKN